MKVTLINAIDAEYEMCPEAFGGSLKIEEVTQAEDELNIKFPEDFIEFLLRYGSGAVGEAIILGLKEVEFVATPSFIEKSKHFRGILPKGYENFITIGIDGAGNPIGFNFPNTEIITFDFNFGGKEVLAKTFEEYLEKAIHEELNIQF
ncbi:hypothetical protein NCCP2222_26040 [Sporosarcina sp. NCCP-2222]|uniref:SMI1/KNR4 family protein n=1 Tax=Sporosarcina sp. NCCP-2222 TaxID=2935073 RepID=UPI00208AC863|nr:SMI1/KNR4 family protein [Sporosarcina sp. NCCP-2222]GKV56657.1 hypothetical protein NCCP2222_26040 [Sporosarcina sp. NCCP-2222]